MRIQKAAAVLLTVALLLVPASAHGHGNGQHHQAASRPAQTQQVQQTAPVSQVFLRPVCTVESCMETCHHLHNGLPYCGAAHASGYCDGSCAAGAVSRPVCSLANCTETGHHLHNNLPYCGAVHTEGFCDGSCQVTAPTAPTAPAASCTTYSHHHGGHH